MMIGAGVEGVEYSQSPLGVVTVGLETLPIGQKTRRKSRGGAPKMVQICGCW